MLLPLYREQCQLLLVPQIPGGAIEDSCVLDGVMFNKDVTHARMKRRIEKPRLVLLDCPLEYKKGESQTNVEITGETDFSKVRNRGLIITKTRKCIVQLRWLKEICNCNYKCFASLCISSSIILADFH